MLEMFRILKSGMLEDPNHWRHVGGERETHNAVNEVGRLRSEVVDSCQCSGRQRDKGLDGETTFGRVPGVR